ncbi:DUF2079 domain-containing protein [Limnothrix redekei]|uniref:DUF2079 domain-containing protein n=1 Tax=Limnothrix redekei LRLZ20PSL1 TaxID=3112953 RepID=A0ABW7C7R8_9CYAN
MQVVNQWFTLGRNTLRDRPNLRHVCIVAALFGAVTLILGLHRYFTLYASYDQGIFNQVFWNNLHGRWFESSLSSSLSSAVKQDGQAAEVFYRRLGQHFTPALLLWLPIYALHSQAVTLVFLQVGLITAAGFVLYALARQHLSGPVSAWIVTGYYAANAVIGPTFSNFHDLCQIPLFFFTILLAMEKRIWWLFWLVAGLSLLVREDQGIGLFGIGAYMVLSRRFPSQGLGLCTLSFLYVVTCTNVFMPFFSPDISKRFMIERFGQYVGEEEASSIDILKAMLTQPWLLVWELVNPPFETLKYLAGHWLPLAFVPALSPASWIISGFGLLKIFLQQGESALSINIRYAITIVPGMFYGAILWWKSHGDRFKQPKFRQFWAACIALSLLFSFTSNPHRALYFLIPDSVQPWVYVSLPEQWSHVGHVRKVLAQIPEDASIAATTYLVPPLSSRRAIIRLPWTEIRRDDQQVYSADYLVADTWHLARYQVAFSKERGELREFVPLVDRTLAQGQYGVQMVEDGVVLLKLNTPSDPAALAAWNQRRSELLPLIQPTQS